MIQKGKRAAAALSRSSLTTPDSLDGPGLDRAVQARIGDNLRAMYDELLQQPVPDRFRDLLGQLEQPREGSEQKR
jgi:Anti-sigma factor NepR